MLAAYWRIGGDGFKWTEGPVWDKANKRLLFSDIPNNRVVEWSEGGKFKDFLKPAGYSASEDFKGKEPGSNGHQSPGKLALGRFHGSFLPHCPASIRIRRRMRFHSWILRQLEPVESCRRIQSSSNADS